ncbi:MAG: hypothetical protein ACYSTT_18145, partial [Planctomycetota bacterium]
SSIYRLLEMRNAPARRNDDLSKVECIVELQPGAGNKVACNCFDNLKQLCTIHSIERTWN